MKLRAFSLAEVLLASGLFLALTSVVAGVLVTTFRRSLILDDKQECLNRFMLARNFLVRRLANASLQTAASNSTKLVYILPETETTALGELNRVNSLEMTSWDSTHPREVSIQDLNGQRVLLEQASGWSDPHSLRKLWAMGPIGNLEINTSQLPLLRLTLTTQDRFGKAWKSATVLRVENYL